MNAWSHTYEPRYICSHVTHVRTRHITPINTSWHTYEKVMSHTEKNTAPVLGRLKKVQGTHTCERVVSFSHVPQEWVQSHTHTNPVLGRLKSPSQGPSRSTRQISVAYRALFVAVAYKALFVEYRALLTKYRAFSTRCRTVWPHLCLADHKVQRRAQHYRRDEYLLMHIGLFS